MLKVIVRWCKKKRKRVVIYSESDGEDKSDDEGPRAKIDVKAKNDEIGIIVEKCSYR